MDTLTLTYALTLSIDWMLELFEAIKTELGVEIKVLPGIQNHSSLITENPTTIQITGNPARIELARVQVLARINEIMYECKTETFDLPLKLQYLVCGRKRVNLLPIIEETACTLYFPSPFTDQANLPIHITGDPTQISRAKDMLTKLSIQKAKSMYHKDIQIYALKIDWLLMNKRDELRKIMHDNGAYIQFPKLGSGETVITVYADSRINAERTLRALNEVVCQIYAVSFYFKQDPDSPFATAARISGFCDAQISDSEVLCQSEAGCINVLGSERGVRNVFHRLTTLQVFADHHIRTQFSLEVSSEQNEFVRGKKDGKTNKIVKKTAGIRIKFTNTLNKYNSLIEIQHPMAARALDGLNLLQDELPAEISFYVPEVYHKRIIGTGGKSIQEVMKQYGVFVKFCNTEEFTTLGGYQENHHNVIARTPMKNHLNLDRLRHAIMKKLQDKDRNNDCVSISIPFYIHAHLVHHYQDTFFNQLLKDSNVQVLWPEAELGSSTVQLLGSEFDVQAAIEKIDQLITVDFDLHFPCNEDTFKELVRNDGFQSEIVDVLMQNYGVEIQTYHKDNDGVFRLIFARSQIATPDLKDTLDTVIDFLTARDITLYEGTTSHLLADTSRMNSINKNYDIDQEFSMLMKNIHLSASASTPITSTSTPLMTDNIHRSNSTSVLNNNWKSPVIRAIFQAPLPAKPTGRSPITKLGLPMGNAIWAAQADDEGGLGLVEKLDFEFFKKQ